MFKEIKSEAELNAYCDNITQEYWETVVEDKSFVKVNPEDYEDFDIEKYPNGMVPLREYLYEWTNIMDSLWDLFNENVVFMLWEE